MTGDWLRSVVLATLVVGSIGVAVSTPVVGSGSEHVVATPTTQADDFNALAPRGLWNPASGTGEMILDSRSYYPVFRGEADVDAWRDTNGSDVSGTTLVGEGGQAEDDVFELTGSIPPDQATGRYSGDGLSAQVRDPRISDVELYNSIGTELDDASELQRDEPMLVVVDWNYVVAEDLQVELRDRETGITIQREVLSTAPTEAQADLLPGAFDRADLAREVQGTGTTGFRTAYWLFDFEAVDAGSYTLRIEGVDDLTGGDAAETVRIDVGTAATPGGSPTATATPAPTPTPTPTPEPTATPDATPTAAPTPTPTAVPPATPTPTGTPVTTPGPTNTAATTPTATPGGAGPGFGPAGAVVAACLAAGWALYRRR